jgi:hypothetical protein
MLPLGHTLHRSPCLLEGSHQNKDTISVLPRLSICLVVPSLDSSTSRRASPEQHLACTSCWGYGRGPWTMTTNADDNKIADGLVALLNELLVTFDVR